MNITHKIKLDMQSNSKRQNMYVKQGDSMSRTAEITLYDGGKVWNVPETASILQIAYYKPDRTGGVYDTMPDNTAACTYSGNVVTARLHPQMFTVSGIVLCELRMANDDGMQLSTFSWFMFVAESATNKMTSEDYFNYASLNAMREDVGILKDLLTKDKTSLVAAINELAGYWGADVKKFAAVLENFTDGDALGLPVYDPVAEDDFVPMLIQRGADEPEGKSVTVLSEGAVLDAIGKVASVEEKAAHYYDTIEAVEVVLTDTGCYLQSSTGKPTNKTAQVEDAAYAMLHVSEGERYRITTFIPVSSAILFYAGETLLSYDNAGTEIGNIRVSDYEVTIPKNCTVMGVSTRLQSTNPISIKKVIPTLLTAENVLAELSAQKAKAEDNEAHCLATEINDDDRMFALENRLGFAFSGMEQGQIVFITDGTRPILTDVYAIMKAHNAVLSVAPVISGIDDGHLMGDGSTQLDFLHTVENDGGEIYAHSMNGDALNAENALAMLRDSKQRLASEGFDVHGWIAPKGIFCAEARRLYPKYYRYGYRASDEIGSQFNMARPYLTKLGLDGAKALVDECEANKSVQVLFHHWSEDEMHPSDENGGNAAGFVGFTTDDLEELLTYIATKNVKITTYKDCFYAYGGTHQLTEEVKTAITEAVAKSLPSGKIVLSKDSFVQGIFTFGVGIEASDFWITTNPPIPVKAGDKVSIKPNGCKVQIRFLNNASLLEATIATAIGTFESDSETVVDADGWLCFMVKNDYGITPDGYNCDISVGKSEFEKIRDEMDELRESIPSPFALSVSPKSRPFTQIVNDCQNTSDWRITNSSEEVLSVDTDDHIMWKHSLHSDSQMRCTTSSYNLLDNNIVLKLKINSIADNARLYMRLRNKDKSEEIASYELMRGTANAPTGVWLELSIPYNSYYSISGNPDFRNINDVQIVASGGMVDWNLQYVGTRPKVLNSGIVSFTFDDGYKSQYTGIKLLAEKGITGTVYPSSLTIEEGNTTYMTVKELQELVNYYGADIEVHNAKTYDEMSQEEIKSHWTENQRLLKENGLSEGKHMAYPGGMHPAEVVQLAKGFFTSCRTISGLLHAESFPPADLFRIRAVSSIGAAGYNVDYVKDKIDRAIASGSWLILVFHRIEDGDTSMYCSEADLSAIADYAIASGAKIMNIAEVFDSTLSNRSFGAGSGATQEQVQAAVSAALGEVEAELEALL